MTTTTCPSTNSRNVTIALLHVDHRLVLVEVLGHDGTFTYLRLVGDGGATPLHVLREAKPGDHVLDADLRRMVNTHKQFRISTNVFILRRIPDLNIAI